MPEFVVKDFRGGLADFFSPSDLPDNQFQTFTEVDNRKQGKLEKSKGASLDAAAISTNTVGTWQSDGWGFLNYRTEWDNAGTPAQNSTFWYLACWAFNSVISYISRYDESDGTGGTWENILTISSSGDWTDGYGTEEPLVDFYVANQQLRISDGAFNANNDSKWYGFIKRDIFGQGLSNLVSYIPTKPSDASALSTWVLENQEIKPPTAVSMEFAFDKDNAVNAANEVGICIHHPTTTNELLNDLDADTFENSDKYAVTFVYDYVQESTLSKDGSGNIGVRSKETLTSKKYVPCIQLVVYTDSWNKRITGINLYWQPDGDVDWYLVSHLDTNEAWSDDPKALEISAAGSATTTDSATNMGYWIACPDLQTLRPAETITSGTAVQWTVLSENLAGAGYSVDDFIWAGTNSTWNISLTKTDCLISNLSAFQDNPDPNDTIELVDEGIDYTDTQDSTPAARYLRGAPIDTSKAATWYIPNDGVRGSTYTSRTGMEQDEKRPAVKWKTSAVSENRAFIGNVDTKDENDQTVRERSRVFWSEIGKYDSFNIINSMDIGKNDGDEVVSLQYHAGRLYILKERNTYVLNVSTSQFFIEAHYSGYGCSWRNASVVTPYGVVASDDQHITLFKPDGFQELSLPIKETFEGLSKSRSVIGYSPKENEIYYLSDTYDSSALPNFFKYNFNTKSWSQIDNPIGGGTWSNFGVGRNLEPTAYYITTGGSLKVVEMNRGSATSNTATVKTKKFDLGVPHRQKSLLGVGATYKTSSTGGDDVTMNLYFDGNTSADVTKTFTNSNTITNGYKKASGTFKTVEVELTASSSTLEIEDVSLKYRLKGTPAS